MLILVLGSQTEAVPERPAEAGGSASSSFGAPGSGFALSSARPPSTALPSDIYELYQSAIAAAIGLQLPAELVPAASDMLRVIATANHLAFRRTFSLADARASLNGHAPLARLWEELLAEGDVPLIKAPPSLAPTR